MGRSSLTGCSTLREVRCWGEPEQTSQPMSTVKEYVTSRTAFHWLTVGIWLLLFMPLLHEPLHDGAASPDLFARVCALANKLDQLVLAK